MLDLSDATELLRRVASRRRAMPREPRRRRLAAASSGLGTRWRQSAIARVATPSRLTEALPDSPAGRSPTRRRLGKAAKFSSTRARHARSYRPRAPRTPHARHSYLVDGSGSHGGRAGCVEGGGGFLRPALPVPASVWSFRARRAAPLPDGICRGAGRSPHGTQINILARPSSVDILNNIPGKNAARTLRSRSSSLFLWPKDSVARQL